VQTTYHVSVDNFVAERALFLVTACFEFGDKPMNCAHCGTAIKWSWHLSPRMAWLTFAVAPGEQFGSIFRTAPDARRHPTLWAVSISATVRTWLHD
jgi:hypothetical protein